MPLKERLARLPSAKQIKVKVVEGERQDVGRWRVRLSKGQRLGLSRHSLLKLTVLNSGAAAYVIGLGHEQGDGVIQMDLDIREQLAVTKDETVVLKVQSVGWFGKVRWYLFHPDPYIHVPAWLAIWSFMIGIASMFPVYSWAVGLAN